MRRDLNAQTNKFLATAQNCS